MACGKLLVALLLQSHHSHTILQPRLELWSYVSEYAFVSHIIISGQCRVSLSICGLCSLCALDRDFVFFYFSEVSQNSDRKSN